jgi:DNA-binding transcriptional ArsR family regulator
MGINESSETRRKVYVLAVEGRTGTEIAEAVGISKQAVSKHLLALVSDGYLRPLDPRSRPRIYRRTSKPYPDKSTDDHRVWSPVVRGHRTGRIFRLTSPPKRCWPWLWDNSWVRSGVNHYVVRNLPIETIEGTINVKSIRYVEGPVNSSLTIWIDDEDLKDGFQILAHEDYATETSILVVNEIARRTGLRVSLPEILGPGTEYGVRAPPGVVDVALEEGIETDKVHFDRSKGDGEVETTDRDIALTWIHLPEELKLLRQRQDKIQEALVEIGKLAESFNRTFEAVTERIEDLDKRTRFLEDPVEIVEDPPEVMYQ